MEKIYIKNRTNQNLSVIVERGGSDRGLAFVTHGMGDSKDSDLIQTCRRCFVDNNYTVISFDTTNTFGESDGAFEDATITTYYNDLEDVIVWAQSQDFFQTPYVLCGHSLGAGCSAFYAEQYPESVKALVSIAAVINAELSKLSYSQEELDRREKTGFLTENWGDIDVTLKRAYMQEKEKYNLLLGADKLTMPSLIIVGEKDSGTPTAHQQMFFQQISGPKAFHEMKGAPHTFRDAIHLQELYDVLYSWIGSLSK